MIIPVLVSYAYKSSLNAKGRVYLQKICDTGNEVHIFLDSGAYTYFTRGRVVNLDGYCDWINSILELSEDMGFNLEYVCLDRVGDQLTTHRNFKKMLNKGLKDTIPVFTRGGKMMLLKSYLKTRPRLALGGLGTRDRTGPRYVRDLYKACPELLSSGCKVHWFGFTDRDFIAGFRPASCDSSSAMAAAQRFKQVAIYNTEGSLRQGINKGRFNENVRHKHILRLFCERHGIDYANLCHDEAAWVGDSSPSCVASIASHLQYIQKVRRTTGTMNYIVIGKAEQLISIKEALCLL